MGEANHAVAVDPAQVRSDERLRDELRIRGLEAEFFQARGREGGKLFVRNQSFGHLVK